MPNTQVENKLKEELKSLKSKTLLLIVLVFSVIGVLIGYYVSGNIFDAPFKDVSVDVLGESTVRVGFETSFPAKTKVVYGTSEMYTNEQEVSSNFTKIHEVYLDSLLPNKDHIIKLVAREMDGREHISPSYKIE